MNFREAQNFIVPFGKYRGKSIDVVASTDDGLLYLDWLRGSRIESNKSDVFDTALATYLEDATIARELSNLQ